MWSEYGDTIPLVWEKEARSGPPSGGMALETVEKSRAKISLAEIHSKCVVVKSGASGWYGSVKRTVGVRVSPTRRKVCERKVH